MQFQFATTRFERAVSGMESTDLGPEITLTGNTIHGQATRFLRIRKSDTTEFVAAITALKESMLETAQSEDKIEVGGNSIGLTKCRRSGAVLIGLWITKNLQQDADTDPILVVPLEIAATLQMKLKNAAGDLVGDFGVMRKIDLPAGVAGAFRVLIRLSIHEDDTTGRWLRIEQYFGVDYEKSAVFYVPEKHMHGVVEALSIAHLGETQTFGGIEIGRPPGKSQAKQVCLRYFSNSHLKGQTPADTTKEAVRIPDKAVMHVIAALRDMTGQHDE